MFCPQCGEKNADDARFCGACGASLRRAAAPAAPVRSAASAPAPVVRKGRLPLVVALASLVAMAAAGVAAWLVFFAPFDIDERNFPDAALRAAVAETYDADHDGKLSREEGRAVTEISLSGAAELAGLGRAFPNVSALTVTGGALTRLDVGDLPALTSLDVADEPLAAVDVSQNPSLASLRVPDQTEVAGLEATGLTEVWVIDKVEETNGYYVTTYSVERDESGRVTARETSSDDGPSERWTYSYDEAGRCVAGEGEHLTDEGDRTLQSVTYSYDDAGRLASAVEAQGPNDYAHTYSYDDEGRLVEDNVQTHGGMSGRTLYSYDDAGRLVGETMQYDDQPSTSVSYAYDDAGRCLSETSLFPSYFEEGEADASVLSYTLDGVGNVTRVEFSMDGYDLGDTYRPVEFAYDERGRRTGATCAFGTSQRSATLSFDERGLVTQAQEVLGSGAETTFTPTYTRYFVGEGEAGPDAGIEIGLPVAPIVRGQHETLVGIAAVPRVVPDLAPYAAPGESMILLW